MKKKEKKYKSMKDINRIKQGENPNRLKKVSLFSTQHVKILNR